MMGMRPGDVFEDKGYTSTSLSKEISEAFTYAPGGRVLFNVTIPKGAPATYLDLHGEGAVLSISEDASECEMVLPPGQFRVTGRRVEELHAFGGPTQVTVYDVEVLPPIVGRGKR
jgi:hypothetical protein